MKRPCHLAIIMDGNGRWAQRRGRDRVFGHIRGARIAREVIEACSQKKIQYLTLFAFSSENWQRPAAEVSFLMFLLKRHLNRERESLQKNNIRFRCIGDLNRLPAAVFSEVSKTIELTSQNTGLQLIFALSYGARQEITSAFKQIANKIQTNELVPSQINEELIESYLCTWDIPDPDLIIRTSGESRLSNFMLWQAAYSEIYLTPTLWPDFAVAELDIALEKFNYVERRFGRTAAQILTDPMPAPFKLKIP